MTPEELSAYAAVATLFVSIVIAVILQRWSSRVAKAEHDRSIREWWNSLNETALSSDEMLIAADRLMSPNTEAESVEQKRRRWFAFLILNALSSMYVGARAGLSNSKDTLTIVEHHLHIILKSDDIYWQSQSGYEKDFSNLCKRVRAALEAKREREGQSASPPSTNST